MKKILVSTVFVGVISFFGLTLPVLASDSVDDIQEKSNNILGEKYEYNYNGIDITTNVKKTESELKELYESVMNQTSDSKIQNEGYITPFGMDDPGDTTVIYSPPNYRTYTHWTLNTAYKCDNRVFCKVYTKSFDK